MSIVPPELLLAENLIPDNVLYLISAIEVAYAFNSLETLFVSGLCVRAGNRSTKVDIITKVQLKNYR